MSKVNINFTTEMFHSFNTLYREMAVYTHNIYGAESCVQRADAVYCASGFTVSIQAGSSLYCSPRKSLFDPESQNNFFDEYTTFELGFPNMEEELLRPYASDAYDLTGTVYPQVPREVIEAVMLKHGGVVRMIEGSLSNLALEDKND